MPHAPYELVLVPKEKYEALCRGLTAATLLATTPEWLHDHPDKQEDRLVMEQANKLLDQAASTDEGAVIPADAKDIMPVADFSSSGFLQEVNRLFFHPRGLALSVSTDDDGKETLGPIFLTNDPSGFFFGNVFNLAMTKAKAEYARTEFDRRQQLRMDKLGYIIQSVDDMAEPDKSEG